MNYMKELNAFREWLLVNPLPTSAIVLWYTLMSLNNMTRWKKTFNAPNKILEQLTGLSKQSIHQARNILVEHGLIKCQKGSRDEAPKFQMLSLIEADDTETTTKEDASANSFSIDRSTFALFSTGFQDDETLDEMIDEELMIHRQR